MAAGKIVRITADGGTIVCTDSTAGGAPRLNFLTEDVQYGAAAKGDSVTYYVGHTSDGKITAKNVSA